MYQNEEKIAEYSLVAAGDVNKASFRQMVSRFFKKYFSGSRLSYILKINDERRISPPLRRISDFRRRVIVVFRQSLRSQNLLSVSDSRSPESFSLQKGR